MLPRTIFEATIHYLYGVILGTFPCDLFYSFVKILLIQGKWGVEMKSGIKYNSK
jgi:hypothetical protein